MQTGTYIQDGEVKWIITDIRDNAKVGHITFETELLEGYLKLNGANVVGSEYPRLLAWRNRQSAEVQALFPYEEDGDTLTLPNLAGRFIEGGESVGLVEAGLPNIEGRVKVRGLEDDGGTELTGAFTKFIGDTYNHIGSTNTFGGFSFDASKSNPIYGNSTTVQPPAFTLIPQIKY